MEVTPTAVRQAIGFAVADVRGRQIGRVVAAMYGRSVDEPDALAVRGGPLRWRHYVVPTAAIDAIDERTRVVALRLPAGDLRRFL